MVLLPGLGRLRTQAALTQGELADRAGIQRQTINRLERGGDAEMPTVRKIAQALDCTVAELMASGSR